VLKAGGRRSESRKAAVRLSHSKSGLDVPRPVPHSQNMNGFNQICGICREIIR
jgi:hypothetical protein